MCRRSVFISRACICCCARIYLLDAALQSVFSYGILLTQLHKVWYDSENLNKKQNQTEREIEMLKWSYNLRSYADDNECCRSIYIYISFPVGSYTLCVEAWCRGPYGNIWTSFCCSVKSSNFEPTCTTVFGWWNKYTHRIRMDCVRQTCRYVHSMYARIVTLSEYQTIWQVFTEQCNGVKTHSHLSHVMVLYGVIMENSPSFRVVHNTEQTFNTLHSKYLFRRVQLSRIHALEHERLNLGQ